MNDDEKKSGNGTPAPAPMRIVAPVNEETLHELLTATVKLLEAYTASVEATLKLVGELDQLRAHGLKVQP